MFKLINDKIKSKCVLSVKEFTQWYFILSLTNLNIL